MGTYKIPSRKPSFLNIFNFLLNNAVDCFKVFESFHIAGIKIVKGKINTQLLLKVSRISKIVTCKMPMVLCDSYCNLHFTNEKTQLEKLDECHTTVNAKARNI